MITRIVKMTVADSKRDEFIRYVDEIRDKIQSFKGCLHLDIFNDKQNSNIFFSYSIWKSEKELENYRRSELFRLYWSTLKTFFTKDTQAWTVENVFNDQPE
ncbi:MAG: antibiotic biosynthesis monooxygenase [Bacteroidetes bacterium]|nr:antibiotic biosynthesis monooxygenase [Bacteroidota bacterium]